MIVLVYDRFIDIVVLLSSGGLLTDYDCFIPLLPGASVSQTILRIQDPQDSTDATSHLYKRVCLSVGPSVGNAFVKIAENHAFLHESPFQPIRNAEK